MELRGKLLDVSNLKVSFYTYRGVVKALNGVELWMDSGERLGVVGETGCGKSVTSLAVMRLIEQPGEIQEGKIIFNGRNLVELSEEKMNNIRGVEMSMIFQEPRSSLNPVMKVGYQIGEAIAKSKKIRIKNTYPEVKEMLRLVGLDAERVMNSYPHELSGGMSQRVMIGMALATHPKLLIADEPTSALDVTIQAQILELLDELARKMGNAVMLITHDMGVVAEFCDKVLVMYAGNSVEYASTVRLFEKPLHPYTGGLLQAVPRVGRTDELKAIKGTVPDLVNPPSGCRFHPRCPYAMDICKAERPPFVEIEPDHYVACYLFKGKNEVREDG
ncbi:oligopeptide/dipeptide ABC transporter, ATP-binding protein [Mesotoga prima MesG1.Ag.4.2]|uniref:Oligopeptide/dipeptide ABC transporter, ATP-binding protein n=3 Tax=Mesotoga prima TaxID=1184387 RepID=I2F800_9BACT|nr:oligopeptide/dipeptide ABC transporter ATP-binding protein [Mesotoga prima]AFK08053.1 oligopeptide/dipeptide ABC transporter, ATP-binding protein [Mesotoga prima MesG1.Ag.4.2]